MALKYSHFSRCTHLLQFVPPVPASPAAAAAPSLCDGRCPVSGECGAAAPHHLCPMSPNPLRFAPHSHSRPSRTHPALLQQQSPSLITDSRNMAIIVAR